MPLTPSEQKIVDRIMGPPARPERSRPLALVDPGHEPDAVRLQREKVSALLRGEPPTDNPPVLATAEQIKEVLREPDTIPAPEYFKRNLNI